MRSYNGYRGVNRRSEPARRLRTWVAKFVASKTRLGLPDLSSPYLCQALVLIRTAGCVVLLRSKRATLRAGTITDTPAKPWQSSRHTWSNQRPNGRFWATLPVGLTRVNGSQHLVPPTTACTGGHPFVDACMQSGSERSPWSVWSLSYTAHHVRRRHCRPVSLVAHAVRLARDWLSC